MKPNASVDQDDTFIGFQKQDVADETRALEQTSMTIDQQCAGWAQGGCIYVMYAHSSLKHLQASDFQVLPSISALIRSTVPAGPKIPWYGLGF